MRFPSVNRPGLLKPPAPGDDDSLILDLLTGSQSLQGAFPPIDISSGDSLGFNSAGINPGKAAVFGGLTGSKLATHALIDSLADREVQSGRAGESAGGSALLAGGRGGTSGFGLLASLFGGDEEEQRPVNPRPPSPIGIRPGRPRMRY